MNTHYIKVLTIIVVTSHEPPVDIGIDYIRNVDYNLS